VAVVAVVLTLAVVGVLFAKSTTGRRMIDGSTTQQEPAAGEIAVPRPKPLAFDPLPGSGVEHDDELPFLVDGDPATLWSTENYRTNLFGGLKPGVGVVLQLSGASKLEELRVTSPSEGWAVEVLVAASPQSTRQAWGEPVATKKGIAKGSTTLNLGGRTAGAVLLWITDLGEGNSVVSIAELRLS